jgi:crotonobetainyl-CoA:carnitine CoA-transferase CaiB-like acyl-CoA transferase
MPGHPGPPAASPPPLQGIRVADFTMHAAGPFATLLLAELGAEVIKVESAARLDITRRPHPVYGRAEVPPFDMVNAGKRSVTLNLKTPAGVDLARRLVAVSDVVTENFRPGVMERLGLGYLALRAVRPDLIMLSISTSGQTGPERGIAGYAPMFAALGGLGEATGYADGPPVELRHAMDHTNGLVGAFAVLAALHHRRRTGQGQHIDLAMREVAASLIGETLLAQAMNGQAPRRMGNRDLAMVPHGVYPCRGEDRWVGIAVGSDAEWGALRRALGDPEWARDPALEDAVGRRRREGQIDGHLSAWCRERSVEEVVWRLQRVGVAATPSMSAQDLLHDPHLREREAFPVLEDPRRGHRRVVGPPWRFSETPASVRKWSPDLGEDNQDVLAGLLGLTPGEIDALGGEGVVA